MAGHGKRYHKIIRKRGKPGRATKHKKAKDSGGGFNRGFSISSLAR